jgi:hypothetical protein
MIRALASCSSLTSCVTVTNPVSTSFLSRSAVTTPRAKNRVPSPRHPHTVRQSAARLGSGPQDLLRHPSRAVLGGEEDVERLPEDVVLRVPLQSLGRPVPGQDVSLRVEQENGVLAGPVDHPRELVEGRRGLGLRSPPTGDVVPRHERLP